MGEAVCVMRITLRPPEKFALESSNYRKKHRL